MPGHTADHHPEAVAAIVAAGHEVGHHGYLHRGTDGLDAGSQRAELEEGLSALGRHGIRPAGYRPPGWELSPETLAMLAGLGFSYDSSLMADDRPYWQASETAALLELPGHWSLCDWPYFGWTPYHGGLLADPAAVERIWLEEYESARQDHRAITYTLHPEAIGRGYLLQMLRRVITGMLSRGPPVVRHPRPDRRPGGAAGHPGRSPCSHQRRPEPHAGTILNQQRYHPRAPAIGWWPGLFPRLPAPLPRRLHAPAAGPAASRVVMSRPSAHGPLTAR